MFLGLENSYFYSFLQSPFFRFVSYKNKITKYHKISYFGFNIDRNSIWHFIGNLCMYYATLQVKCTNYIKKVRECVFWLLLSIEILCYYCSLVTTLVLGLKPQIVRTKILWLLLLINRLLSISMGFRVICFYVQAGCSSVSICYFIWLI